MDVKRIVLLFAISLCWLSCSDSHTEPEENENPDNATTIYDLFPDYNKYDNLYHVIGSVELQNISTQQLKIFPAAVWTEDEPKIQSSEYQYLADV